MKYLRRLMFNQRGSIVVEASIVVPFIILSIISVIYIALLLFQHAYMQTLADSAAERGAVIWSNKSKDIIIAGKLGIDDLGREGLYWRLIDPDKQDKESKVTGYIDSKMGGYNLLHGIDKKVTVELKDYIVYKKLVVRTESTYRLPLGNLLHMFGFEQYYKVSGESEAIIDDPTEFVRNVDFVLDTERELESRYAGIRDMGEKMRGIIDSIKDKIYKFFK